LKAGFGPLFLLFGCAPMQRSFASLPTSVRNIEIEDTCTGTSRTVLFDPGGLNGGVFDGLAGGEHAG
jgi:hypothetical protein